MFPGQGSQRVGMGAQLVAEHAAARHVFAEVDDALGFSLSALCASGPEDTLALTEHAQPAILAVSVALFRTLAAERALAPVALAGHSLGEWSALVAAGAIGLADAVRGVRERGRLMQSAVPVGVGAMAAVLGLDLRAVTALCGEAAAGDVLAPANLNGGGQIVVAGHATAVERLVVRVGAHGGRAQRLKVSAPFHCALMEPAAVGLERVLATLEVFEAQWVVVSSVDAEPITRERLKANLVRQVTAPVRWEETARAVASRGPTVVLEVGPGRALAGMLKRIVPDLRVIAAGEPGGVAAALEVLA